MHHLLQILLCLLLYFPLAHGDDYGQVTVTRSLPEVECTSDLLNAEILHYLSRQDQSHEIIYWNLTLQISPKTSPAFYTCAIMRQADFVPHEGKAYLRYGNDVFVIEGKYDKSLFRRRKGQKMDIKMVQGKYWVLSEDSRHSYGTIDKDTHVAYFMITFSDDKVFRIRSEYDPFR